MYQYSFIDSCHALVFSFKEKIQKCIRFRVHIMHEIYVHFDKNVLSVNYARYSNLLMEFKSLTTFLNLHNCALRCILVSSKNHEPFARAAESSHTLITASYSRVITAPSPKTKCSLKSS
jgi:hypothetical protein